MKLKVYSNLRQICFFIVVSCISISTLTAEPYHPGYKHRIPIAVSQTQERLFKGKTLFPLISVTPDTLQFVWDDSKAKMLFSSRSTTNPTYNQAGMVPSSFSGLGPGTTAPNFTLPDTNGANHSLSDFAGKVVLITWWAST